MTTSSASESCAPPAPAPPALPAPAALRHGPGRQRAASPGPGLGPVRSPGRAEGAAGAAAARAPSGPGPPRQGHGGPRSARPRPPRAPRNAWAAAAAEDARRVQHRGTPPLCGHAGTFQTIPLSGKCASTQGKGAQPGTRKPPGLLGLPQALPCGSVG